MGPFERGFHADQGQPLLVTAHGYVIEATEAICYCLLPVLDQEACGRAHMANQGQLLPALGLGKLSKGSRAPQVLRPSVGFPQGSAAEGVPGGMRVGCSKVPESHQGGIGSAPKVSADPELVSVLSL